jgi:hypothetical protein
VRLSGFVGSKRYWYSVMNAEMEIGDLYLAQPRRPEVSIIRVGAIDEMSSYG